MTHQILLSYHTNPEFYFSRLKQLSDFVWLDSGRPACKQGRYDIFTGDAKSVATLASNAAFSSTDQCSFEDWIRKYMPSKPQNDIDLPFTGGVIGYFNYDWQHASMGVASWQPYSNPHVQLGYYDWAIIVDHKTQRCIGVFQDEQRQTTIQELLKKDIARPEPFKATQFTADTKKTQYAQAIKDIKEYILAGDCYQVNYTQRFSSHYTGSLSSAYATLREATPSPFGAYIATPNGALLSLSPERFLQFNNGAVLSQPIKGSRPRGESSALDKKLAEELLASDKDRAENVMIVDLLRNDLSQCCEPGSVKVPKLCELESFANVHHLVSNVEGTLKPEHDAFALFKASFPGGSITGAPKKRAMEIIHELEPHSRGSYCGSIAYFSNNGRADSSITIRTLQAENGHLYCWGGGGIVLDSNAESEYQESLFKVQKLMDAVN